MKRALLALLATALLSILKDNKAGGIVYQFPMGEGGGKNTFSNLKTPVEKLPQGPRMPAKMRASVKT